VGTFEIAEAFANYKMMTCIHKHYSVEEWEEFAKKHADDGVLNYIAVSSGTSDSDFQKTNDVLAKVNVPFICLDVANGYSEHVSQSHQFSNAHQ
jgi:GMP reductase